MFIALFPYFLILFSFGMAIWAKSLYLPIHTLSVSKIVEGSIYSFLNSGVEGSMNTNVIWELVVPGILLVIASSLLLLAAYFIFKQVMGSPELSLNNIIKGSIIALSIVMMFPFLFSGGKLLVLTFLSFIMLLFVPVFMISVLVYQKREY